jgi:hypothetical protein
VTICAPEDKTYRMKDLTDSRWINLKGILFLGLGIVSSLLLLLEAPTIKVAGLLALSIWCFCRFYYFCFYVIQHYVDPGFRFSGLWSFARYWWSRQKRKRNL